VVNPSRPGRPTATSHTANEAAARAELERTRSGLGQAVAQALADGAREREEARTWANNKTKTEGVNTQPTQRGQDSADVDTFVVSWQP
jgi:hypothetical protein